MWRTIAEHKNKYTGCTGTLVGTGPSADMLNDWHCARVLIGINRAIVCSDEFDFVFVDHPKTLHEIWPYVANTRYICMPFYSREECNLNDMVVQEAQQQDKLLLYGWSYQSEATITEKYSLNDALLYVSWGNAQSAVHFAKLIGLSRLEILGCDGGSVNGRTTATKIEQLFGVFSGKVADKRISDYRKTRAKMLDLAKLCGVVCEFPGEERHP